MDFEYYMNEISFKANINTNLAKIQTERMFDKFFVQQVNRQNLDKVIQKVDSLAEMKENSSVQITPRLDNNMLNLICKVNDDMSIVKTTIKERSGRKLAQDSNFAERFVQNIAKAIRNVDKTKKCCLEVNNFIKNSQTIKDEEFICNLPRNVLNSLNNNIDPTKRLISILKRIEVEYPDEQNYISIKDFANRGGRDKQRRIYTYFCIRNGQIEKKIPINYIMKDPIDNLFL